jgi:hypothetical protein
MDVKSLLSFFTKSESAPILIAIAFAFTTMFAIIAKLIFRMLGAEVPLGKIMAAILELILIAVLSVLAFLMIVMQVENPFDLLLFLIGAFLLSFVIYWVFGEMLSGK